MKRSILLRNLLSVLLMLSGAVIMAQQNNENSAIKKSNYNASKYLRGKNVIMPAGGSSFINGDLDNPKYETFGQIGYKRFLDIHFNINFNFQKFDLESPDFLDSGFLSFNLNVEYYIFPKKSLSPYFYLGSGLMISTDFTEPNNKFQAGVGLEYLFDKNFGVSLLANGNYVLNVEELSQDIFRDVDELYYGAALGVSFYFGGMKKSSRKVANNNNPTVISSYPIIND